MLINPWKQEGRNAATVGNAVECWLKCLFTLLGNSGLRHYPNTVRITLRSTLSLFNNSTWSLTFVCAKIVRATGFPELFQLSNIQRPSETDLVKRAAVQKGLLWGRCLWRCSQTENWSARSQQMPVERPRPLWKEDWCQSHALFTTL